MRGGRKVIVEPHRHEGKANNTISDGTHADIGCV